MQMKLFSGADARILVVAAHADDEVLGASGTLFSALRSGAAVHVLILSVDSSSRSLNEPTREALKRSRQHAAQQTAELMGWSLAMYDYPDNAFDTLPHLSIVKAIEKEIAAFQPTVVLTHFHGDISRDHQIAASATVTALRPVPERVPATLLFFEIRSSTGWGFGLPDGVFTPNLWVPLDAPAWQAKELALNAYKEELRDWPHPRSREGLLALAKYRGSELGVEMAEAFIVARAVAAGLS